MNDAEGRDVYFEFTVIGTSVKATAIDSVTGIEVSVVGPVTARRNELQRLALAKLERRLTRENG
ncbi:serine hydroxymethyltransferase [Xanthobacteraceae bacterium Astr-EGSB]|uniref:DUF6898 family protein n=1 Tax=Astrobacterium formosum TaxID=3069710 RepID=UPI0027B5EF06|nr:serine hydroxymethyltransferase [Xanthobacteraceae bacterium Astr-EGSB]